MSIFCVACGAELPDGAGFCPHCGTKVEIPHCPACGKELDFDVSFCMYCGQQLKKDDTETGSENEEASVENCGLKSAFEADGIPSEEISSAISGESSDSSTDTEQNIVGSEMAPSFLWSYQKGLQAPIVTTVDVLDDRIHIREARKSSKAEFIRQDVHVQTSNISSVKILGKSNILYDILAACFVCLIILIPFITDGKTLIIGEICSILGLLSMLFMYSFQIYHLQLVIGLQSGEEIKLSARRQDNRTLNQLLSAIGKNPKESVLGAIISSVIAVAVVVAILAIGYSQWLSSQSHPSEEVINENSLKEFIYKNAVTIIDEDPDYVDTLVFPEYVEGSKHSSVELTGGHIYVDPTYGQLYVRDARISGSADYTLQKYPGITLRSYYEMEAIVYLDDDISTKEAKKYNNNDIDDFVDVLSYDFISDWVVLQDGSELTEDQYLESISPTSRGTGLTFTCPEYLDDSSLTDEIEYKANRLLYGVGMWAGIYEPEGLFISTTLNNTCSFGDIKDESGDIIGKQYQFSYMIYTTEGDMWFLDIDAEYGCGENGMVIEGTSEITCELIVPLAISTYHYVTYDGIEFFEILSGEESAERYCNIDTGDWTTIEVVDNSTSPANTYDHSRWPNSANYSWDNIANAGIGIDCGMDDNWYSYGGSDVAVWVASERMWMSEVTILVDEYLVGSKDGINYYVYDLVNGSYVRQWGFSYHMTPNGFESGTVAVN